MNIEPRDVFFGLFMTALVGLLLFMFVNLFRSVEETNKFNHACTLAGGMPLKEYCVKPGSFIEVKP